MLHAVEHRRRPTPTPAPWSARRLCRRGLDNQWVRGRFTRVRASATEATGAAGATIAKANFELLGWGATENSTHDLGTDLLVWARDARRFDLGLLVGVQVKAGPSAFTRPVTDASGQPTGWWFAVDGEHADGWLAHSLPHLLVLQDLLTRTSHWVHITSDTVQRTGKNAKIFVPAHQTVDLGHFDALLAVATSQRPALAWEGSAWTGAPQVPAADRLRWALLLPRLVAPHPNAALSADLTPEQGVAMATLVRLDDLTGQRHGRLGKIPSLADMPSSPQWRWRLVAALHDYLHHGQPEGLRDLAGTANEPADSVAAAVVASAALLEAGRPDEAAALLETRLAADTASPVDQAWLRAQLARSRAELGQLEHARALALEVQGIGGLFPHDATATAVAGAAAHLVFLVSDFGDLDIPTVISASDSTAAWWRTQVLAWGLNAEASQHYRAWSGQLPTDGGWSDLRAASLIAGHTADHAGWRSASSLTARHRLLRATPSTDAALVSNALDTLRLAGDDDHLQRGINKIALDGPAAAAVAVLDQLDLTRSTHTSSRADLAALTTAGDVAPSSAADRHLRDLLEMIADTEGFEARLRPPYLIYPAVLNAVGALLEAAGEDARQAVVGQILSLAPERDQLAALSWARVVAALPRHCWTEQTAAVAAARANDHETTLEYALLAVAAPHQPIVKARLLDEATQGEGAAVDALGRIADIPPNDASELLGIVLDQIGRQHTEAETIGYTFGGSEWAWWLTALNIEFPSIADWSALREEISSPSAHPGHLTSALLLIGARTTDIPPAELSALRQAVDGLRQRPLHPWGSAQLDRAIAWASLTLHEAEGVGKDRVPALLSGTADDRQNAVLLLGRRRDTQPALLAALAFDADHDVRATAAHAVGEQLGHHPDDEDLHRTIAMLLADPGTRVARNLVQGVPHLDAPYALGRHQSLLSQHLSAKVRRSAQFSATTTS